MLLSMNVGGLQFKIPNNQMTEDDIIKGSLTMVESPRSNSNKKSVTINISNKAKLFKSVTRENR